MCEEGRYCEGGSIYEGTICDKGTYCIAGSSEMQMCPPNHYNDKQEQNSCFPCPQKFPYSQEGSSTFSNCFQESDYTGYNASLCKSGFYCLDPTVSTFCFLYKEQTQCIEKDIKTILNDNSFFGTGTTNQKSFETLLAAMNTCNKTIVVNQ